MRAHGTQSVLLKTCALYLAAARALLNYHAWGSFLSRTILTQFHRGQIHVLTIYKMHRIVHCSKMHLEVTFGQRR